MRYSSQYVDPPEGTRSAWIPLPLWAASRRVQVSDLAAEAIRPAQPSLRSTGTEYCWLLIPMASHMSPYSSV